MQKSLAILIIALLTARPVVAQVDFVAEANPADIAEELFSPSPGTVQRAVDWFVERGNKDAVPALIDKLRYSGRQQRVPVLFALITLAEDHPGADWQAWRRWLQAHPEIRPFEDYGRFKSRLLQQIDPIFATLLPEDAQHTIRLEEIVWGGTTEQGIPALVNPAVIPGHKADYLTSDELVFGVKLNGEARAYPLRILDWHEMLNDTIGGVPVALAYCTLCGSGILYKTRIEGREKPIQFGTSGLLYRSNKLMFDHETRSLWSQFEGKPVVGKLVGSGIVLETLPIVITDWGDWLAREPETLVLSPETGYERDYTPGMPYGEYFESAELMFPVDVTDDRLAPKDKVFVLRASGVGKAWPLAAFADVKVWNDVAGAIDLVLIGDAKSQTVRAYRAGGHDFSATGDDNIIVDETDSPWTVNEASLSGPNNETLTRLPGHIAYWFAWVGSAGAEGELASID